MRNAHERHTAANAKLRGLLVERAYTVDEVRELFGVQKPAAMRYLARARGGM